MYLWIVALYICKFDPHWRLTSDAASCSFISLLSQPLGLQAHKDDEECKDSLEFTHRDRYRWVLQSFKVLLQHSLHGQSWFPFRSPLCGVNMYHAVYRMQAANMMQRVWNTKTKNSGQKQHGAPSLWHIQQIPEVIVKPLVLLNIIAKTETKIMNNWETDTCTPFTCALTSSPTCCCIIWFSAKSKAQRGSRATLMQPNMMYASSTFFSSVKTSLSKNAFATNWIPDGHRKSQNIQMVIIPTNSSRRPHLLWSHGVRNVP